jgi:hypothetical protein
MQGRGSGRVRAARWFRRRGAGTLVGGGWASTAMHRLRQVTEPGEMGGWAGDDGEDFTVVAIWRCRRRGEGV